jgi:copper chaperone
MDTPIPYTGDDMSDRTYTVTGMTCDHCVRSVEEEVGEVAGVRAVEVELASGLLTVSGEGFSDDAVRGAVAEAGYRVAG